MRCRRSLSGRWGRPRPGGVDQGAGGEAGGGWVVDGHGGGGGTAPAGSEGDAACRASIPDVAFGGSRHIRLRDGELPRVVQRAGELLHHLAWALEADVN